MGRLKEHATEIQTDGGKKPCLRLIKPGEKRGLREGLETTTTKSGCLDSADLTLKP